MAEFSFSSGGYSCGSCGVWIPTGTTHYCGITWYKSLDDCQTCQKLDIVIEKLTKILDEVETLKSVLKPPEYGGFMKEAMEEIFKRQNKKNLKK